MRKTWCLVVCLVLSSVLVGYAANYKLIPNKISTPIFGVYDGITASFGAVADTQKTLAAYEWNAAVPGVKINNITSFDTAKAGIYVSDSDVGSVLGETDFSYSKVRVTIYTTAISKKAGGDSTKIKKLTKFAIMHEFGHLLGLGDLGLLDTWDSVMSYYADRYNLQAPTANDAQGVKASYGF